MANRGEHLKQYYFPAGTSGNPDGRPKLENSEKELRRYTREHIADVINKVGELKDAEVQLLLSDPDSTQMEKVVAKVMLTARSEGTFSELDKMLDRAIGKVPQKTELEMGALGGGPLPPTTIILEPVKSNQERPKDVPA